MKEIRRSNERGAARPWLAAFPSQLLLRGLPRSAAHGLRATARDQRGSRPGGRGLRHPQPSRHGDRELRARGRARPQGLHGHGSVIRPGDVQRMSAGTGVSHSEFNASKTEPVHFLQIWIIPEKPASRPSYEEKHFDPAERRGRLRLIASPDKAEGSVLLHQDVRIFSGLFDGEEHARLEVAGGRHSYIQVARGSHSRRRITSRGRRRTQGDRRRRPRIQGRKIGRGHRVRPAGLIAASSSAHS